MDFAKCAGRFLVLFSLLSVALGGHTQQDSRLQIHVNRNFRCVQIADLCPELSHMTGVPLKASQDTANLMVFLCVKDRPLGEMMRHVGHALDAEWIRDGAGYRVRATTAHRQRLEQAVKADADAAIARMRAAVREYAKALSISDADRRAAAREYIHSAQGANGLTSGGIAPTPVQTDGRPAAGLVCWRMQSMGVRLAVKLLSGWSDKDWARLYRDHLVVYCTSPTSAQLPLPKEYLSEGKRWQSRVAQTWVRQELPDYLELPVLDRYGKPIAGALDSAAAMAFRVRVSWANDEVYGDLRISSSVLDRSRRDLIDTRPWNVGQYWEKLPDPPSIPRATEWPKVDIHYKTPDLPSARPDGHSERYLEAYVRSLREQAAFHDPIDTVIGEVLTDVADKASMSVATPIDDWMSRATVEPFEGKLSDFLTRWMQCSSTCLQYGTDRHWITGSVLPSWWGVAPKECFPRALLREAQAQLRDGRAPSLDWLAQALAAVPRGCDVWEALPETRIEVSGPWRYRGQTLARFWLDLSTKQRLDLLGGRTLAAGDLTAAARNALCQALSSDVVFATTNDQFGGSQFHRQHEVDWTDAIPNGVPDFATVSLRYETGKYLDGWSRETVTARELCDRMDSNKRAGRKMTVYQGDWWKAEFTFDVKPGASSSGVFGASWTLSPKPMDTDAPDKALTEFIAQGRNEYDEPVREHSR